MIAKRPEKKKDSNCQLGPKLIELSMKTRPVKRAKSALAIIPEDLNEEHVEDQGLVI